MPHIEITSSGAVSAIPTQKRRVMLLNSLSSSSGASVAVRGSSAIPQIGQFPGLARTISGCIGHVYSTAIGSRAMPHFGHGTGLLSRTSGHIGQTYATPFCPEGSADDVATDCCGAFACDGPPNCTSPGDDFCVRNFAGSARKRSPQPTLQK